MTVGPVYPYEGPPIATDAVCVDPVRKDCVDLLALSDKSSSELLKRKSPERTSEWIQQIVDRHSCENWRGNFTTSDVIQVCAAESSINNLAHLYEICTAELPEIPPPRGAGGYYLSAAGCMVVMAEAHFQVLNP